MTLNNKLQMTLVFILSSMSLFSFDASSAMPPSKISVCYSALIYLKGYEALGRTSRVYALNSIESFRKNNLGAKNIQGALPEGLFSDRSSRKNLNLAAQRLKGIETFARRSEGQQANEENLTLMVTLSGQKNIHDFLTSFAVHPSKLGAKALVRVIRFRALMMIAYGLGSAYNVWPDGRIGFGAILPAALGIENFVRTLNSIDFAFKSQINRFIKANQTPYGEPWLLFSQNYKVSEDGINLATKNPMSALSDYLEESLVNQQLPSTGNLLENLMRSRTSRVFPEGMPNQWAGVDMLYVKSESSEPDLHIVVRVSTNRPSFPEQSSEEDESQNDVFQIPLEPWLVAR